MYPFHSPYIRKRSGKMQRFQICYSAGAYFQSGTPVSELPNSPVRDQIRLPRSASVTGNTIPRFLLDIEVETNLSGGTESTSAASQPCFHMGPEDEQGDDDDTLFAQIRGNFILTELLPPINHDTAAESPERTGKDGTTARRRPLTLVRELHHVHFEADYATFMTRETADFGWDARDLLHDMAQELGIDDNEELSAQVQSVLAYLATRGTLGNKPMVEDEWFDGMYACVEQANEALYVEAFRVALEELHGRCVEYERGIQGHQETGGRELEGETQ